MPPTYAAGVAKRCEFKEPITNEQRFAEPAWIADVDWARGSDEAARRYVGTSWRVALCDMHFEQLSDASTLSSSEADVDGGSLPDEHPACGGVCRRREGVTRLP